MLHHQVGQACFLRLYFLQCHVLSSCCVDVYIMFWNSLYYCRCHQENVNFMKLWMKGMSLTHPTQD